jgi:hypothetical protein
LSSKGEKRGEHSPATIESNRRGHELFRGREDYRGWRDQKKWWGAL